MDSVMAKFYGTSNNETSRFNQFGALSSSKFTPSKPMNQTSSFKIQPIVPIPPSTFNKTTINPNVYDNFTYEKKGNIEIVIKSEEIKTLKDFNLEEQNEKFNIFYSKNQFINFKGNDLTGTLNSTYNKNNKIRAKRKKVVCVPSMNFNKLSKIKRTLYNAHLNIIVI